MKWIDGFKLHIFMTMLLAFSCVEEPKQGGSGGILLRGASVADPLTPYLWHLNPVTVPYVNGEVVPNLAHINLGNLHNSYTGKGVRVVVSDNGVQWNHPDLEKNIDLTLSKNYQLPPPWFGIPFPYDLIDNSHGTGVAGVIAAIKGNGLGGFGVAPSSKIIGYQFLESSQDIYKQIDQSAIQGGNSVFNYSYGSNQIGFIPMDPSYSSVLTYNSIVHNNVYVKASGNDFSRFAPIRGNANMAGDNGHPAVITVGAVNAHGKRASYSSPGSSLWISAPGGDFAASSPIGILGTDLTSCSLGYAESTSEYVFDRGESTLNQNCNYAASLTGTSYAAPVVSGVVALMKEANPNLTWRDIKHILAKTAKKIDPLAGPTSHPGGFDLAGHTYEQGWTTNQAGYNFHNWYGFGLIDAQAAVSEAKNKNFDLHQYKTTLDFENLPLSYSDVSVQVIPNENSTGISRTININDYNLAVESVSVAILLSHTSIKDLGIELVSPAGTVSKLTNLNSGVSNTTELSLTSNAFYGERSRGVWSLRLVDGADPVEGSILGWYILINGNQGSAGSDLTPPLPPSNLDFDVSSNQLSWTPSASGDVVRYEACFFPTLWRHLGCNDGAWRKITNGDELTHYIVGGNSREFEAGLLYEYMIRAVDSSENESTVLYSEFVFP